MKKDEEDFDPAVLHDVAGWLRMLRLHRYTPNFEGMTWKEMVMMDDQTLEAQGVAALGARREMLKTFEVVRRKMGIDAGELGWLAVVGGCSLRDRRDHFDIQRKTFFVFRLKSSITSYFLFRFFVLCRSAFTSSVFGLVIFYLILRETCRACPFFSFRMGGSSGGEAFPFSFLNSYEPQGVAVLTHA